MDKILFPQSFMWGTASSAYQTEGGNFNNDWSLMEKLDLNKPVTERKFKESCGIACDHWNRYEEDYAIAKELGIMIHRPSIEWSRVIPTEGQVDETAIAHYRKILESLKKNRIKVMLCLHHFTIPIWVMNYGGFENRPVFMKHFRDYLDVIVSSVGDLVDYWLPINEPNVVPLGGYFAGEFPPYKKNPIAFIKVYRTFFDMHASSYRIIKKYFPGAPVGVAFAFMHFRPFNPDNKIDRIGARFADVTANLRFFEGVKTGKIGLPLGLWDEIKGLKGAMDFIGLNYYSSSYQKGLANISSKPGDLVTDMGWVIYPEGIYDCIDYLGKEVQLPIIVTENGIGTTDEIQRIFYMDAHIRQIHKAIENGFPVKGYMCWSLTDNYEWDRGYSMRFGLVNVDYATQKRTVKEGGNWYAQVIARNGLE
jgi:beta-glucosidase